MKKLAIALDEGTHARLTVLAQAEGISLTEIFRRSLDRYLEEKSQGAEMQAHAQKLLDELDRDTAARRAAIESLLAKESASEPEAEGTKGTRKRS